MQYEQLLNKYPIISLQIDRPSLGVVLRECEKTLQAGVEGDITEFGCYIGTTSLFLRRLLNEYESDKTLYAYDSFEGLPDKLPQDASGAGEQFQGGELTVSKKAFLQEFKKANLQPPITIKAWFGELSPDQVPNRISFAFLDGDFYQSILDSLELVWPRLETGGTVCFDDYERDALPGVARAVHDYFGHNPIVRKEHNIGILRKPA